MIIKDSKLVQDVLNVINTYLDNHEISKNYVVSDKLTVIINLKPDKLSVIDNKTTLFENGFKNT